VQENAIGPLLLFTALLAVLHIFTGYQLVKGRANCWPWQTKSTVTRWWLYRAEQPLAYWFRIALWSFICVALDGLILSALLKKYG
jgi:hypothetical protein